MKTKNAETAHIWSRGFSLPEVAIAVAIAALGLVTLLGLMPSGLENIRRAGNAIATARIYQQMISEIQSADWGDRGTRTASGKGVDSWPKLQAYQSARRYFDSEGTALPTSDVRGQALAKSDDAVRVAYVGAFDFVAPAPLLSGVTGAPAAAGQEDTLRVILHVAITPNLNYNFGSGKAEHENRAFTVTRQF